MQLIRVFAVTVLVCSSALLYGQDTAGDLARKEQDHQWLTKTALKNVEVDILGSYYAQDGNHSPVTGGRGTESLTDITPAVIVNIPLDSAKALSVNVGTDLVTSASTDNMDFIVSSASRRDLRYHFHTTYTQRLAHPRLSYSFSAGLSKEFDVFSKSVGASIIKESRSGNTEIGFNSQAYFDAWSLYFPVEFRPFSIESDDPQGHDHRNSYNLGLTFSQILTKRLDISLSLELVQQEGLLSTPFHRVFFNDGINVDGLNTRDILFSSKLRKIEHLPRSRTRVPLGVRVNYYISDLFIIRGYYRYYHDDFGITGNTYSVDFPVKVSPFFVLTPFYRFHTQTASNYFAPFGQHELTNEFYSSDYDQSAFDTNKFGLGIRYSPLNAISIFKTPFTFGSGHRFTHFKSVELRYAYFNRSDGLTASIISFDLSFSFVKQD